jgi:carbamoyl-phosphate synthase large subunit
MKAGAIQLVIYTTTGAYSFNDEKVIRRTAVAYRIPCITTLSGAKAAAKAVASRRRDAVRVWSLQEIHAGRGSVPLLIGFPNPRPAA